MRRRLSLLAAPILVLLLTGCEGESNERKYLWGFQNDSPATVTVQLLSGSGPDTSDVVPGSGGPPFPVGPDDGFADPVEEDEYSGVVLSVTDASGRELERIPDSKLCDRVLVTYDGTDLVLTRRPK